MPTPPVAQLGHGTEAIFHAPPKLLHGWRVDRAQAGALEDCTLIIATYRRPIEVLKLVEHLAGLEHGPAEVLIVDGSPEGRLGTRLRVWTASRSLPFTLVYVESPCGLTRQRNVGVDVSSGRFVFFLDDDATPLEGYFERIATVLDQHPDIGAAAGCIINEINRPMVRRWQLRFAIGLIPRLEPMTYFPTAMCVPRAMLKPFTGIRMFDIFPGGAVAIRREILEVERFSEFFEGYSQGEDFEMSMRIRRHWLIAGVGDAHVLHHPAPGGRPPGFRKGMMEVVNRHFIWTRYTPHPKLRIRALFWADITFLIAMDTAWFICKPWHASSLSHGAGLFCGALRCLFAPVHYREPAAHHIYSIALARP